MLATPPIVARTTGVSRTRVPGVRGVVENVQTGAVPDETG